NKSNKFAVCKFCIDGSTYDDALKNRITNTQRECRRHLDSCKYFIEKYPSEAERNNILNPILENNLQEKISSTNSSRGSSGKRVRLGLNNDLSLDNYFAKPLSDKQKEKLEQQILRATISCGIAFTWVDDPEMKKLFHYINPAIELPKRRTLSGRILTYAANNIIELQKKDMQIDKLGAMLTYDGWKNIKKESLLGIALINSKGKISIWGVEDLLGKRIRWPEIVEITNDLFSKFEDNDIKVNCLVTDSAPEFMAARSQGLDTSLINFPEDILTNLLDNSWWSDLQQLELLLLLYCAALNKLQCDHARLHDVLHKRRWNIWEQPLLLLSFLLHPKYRDNMFNKQIRNLSFPHFERLYPFRDEDYQQFGKNDDILSFWNFVSGFTEELHLIAQRIFSICISSASIERLFSTMGWLHNFRRNQLKPEKVVAMCQIRSDLIYSRRIEEINESKKKFIQTRVATHATLSKNKDDEISQVSEDENTELDDIEQFEKNGKINSVNEWQETVNNWDSLVIEDEEATVELDYSDEELIEHSFEDEHPA
ncbi:9759_t:CDS:2, partial [Scutellospora calospora]